MSLHQIFPNWSSYMDALTAYCTDPDYAKRYPDYAILPTYKDNNRDIRIIGELLVAGQDPNIGMIKLLYVVMLDAPTLQTYDYLPVIYEMIDKLMRAGAKVPTDIFLAPATPETEWATYPNNEVIGYYIRGRLLDRYGPYTQIHERIVWEDLLPLCWFDELDDEVLTESFRLSHLKYCSKYLQTL